MRSHRNRDIAKALTSGLLLLGMAACGSAGAPSNLPPDPGEAGKQTVEGVDTNGNGVRDDVEIQIFQIAGQDTELREALTNIATATQRVLDSSTADGSEEELSTGVVDMLHADTCLTALQGFDESQELSKAMVMAVVNTSDRILAYYAADEAMHGALLQLPADLSSACSSSELTAAARVREGPRRAMANNEHTCQIEQITNIYFANGVRGSLTSANASLLAINDRFGDFLNSRSDGNYTLNLAFNSSYGFAGWGDFAETFHQKLLEVEGWEGTTEAEALELLFKIENLSSDSGATIANLASANSLVDANALDVYTKIVAGNTEAALRATRHDFELAGTLQNHLQKYRSDLLAGERVLVIAHSQGNLFAMHAYEALAVDDLTQPYVNAMDVISVATPASRAPGTENYVTDTGDHVINALRLLSDGVLPGTHFNDESSAPLRHAFVDFYLANGSQTSAAIERTFKYLVVNTPFLNGPLQSGIINITLEWDEQPDVDLHVIEPDETHVYFGNKQGNSGYLDRDDVTAYGPEHYTVPCESLQAGTYQVGVSYFHGYEPTDYQLQVSVGYGTEVRSFSRTLLSEVGSAGIDSPKPGATITVGYSGDQPWFYVSESRGETIGPPPNP